MLGNEVLEPVIHCGQACDMNKITDSMTTDQVMAKNLENVSRSSSSESLSENMDKKYSDIALLLQMSEKLNFLENSCPSQKELSLHVIVNLPDEENKKEQLSPKEEKNGHQSVPKNSQQTVFPRQRDERKPEENGIRLIPINQTEPQLTLKKDLPEFQIFEAKDNDSHIDSYTSNLYSENATNFLNANMCTDMSRDEKVDDNSQKMSKNLIAHRKSTNQRQKDRLNEERRAESPREVFQKTEKNRPRLHADKHTDIKPKSKQKPRAESRKEEKMKRNKIDKNRESSDRSQDFDSMYRLPTEHLLHRRARRNDDRSSNRVESQLRIHEHKNSQLKLAELDKDRCIGAIGGCNLTPPGSGDSQEDIPTMLGGHRSRSSSGSSETDSNFINDFPRRSEH